MLCPSHASPPLGPQQWSCSAHRVVARETRWGFFRLIGLLPVPLRRVRICYMTLWFRQFMLVARGHPQGANREAGAQKAPLPPSGTHRRVQVAWGSPCLPPASQPGDLGVKQDFLHQRTIVKSGTGAMNEKTSNSCTLGEHFLLSQCASSSRASRERQGISAAQGQLAWF